MNNYVKKNYHIDKEDIKNATANVIDILDKKKKVIIAHDKGKRRNAILGKTIKYIMNRARQNGIKKPIVLSIRLKKSKCYRSNHVIYVYELSTQMLRKIRNIINDDEEIVAIVINDFDILSMDICKSTPLLELIDSIKSKFNVMYEVMTTSGIHDEPICLPFITFRIIDNKFAKLTGIEGTNHLAELFFDTRGETKPQESAYIVNKKIAEYADVDLYNYVNENNFIKPDVIEYNSNEELLNGVLEKITQLDAIDKCRSSRVQEKFHIIIYNNVINMSTDDYDQIKYYAENINNRIERVVICTNLNFF